MVSPSLLASSLYSQPQIPLVRSCLAYYGPGLKVLRYFWKTFRQLHRVYNTNTPYTKLQNQELPLTFNRTGPPIPRRNCSWNKSPLWTTTPYDALHLNSAAIFLTRRIALFRIKRLQITTYKRRSWGITKTRYPHVLGIVLLALTWFQLLIRRIMKFLWFHLNQYGCSSCG